MYYVPVYPAHFDFGVEKYVIVRPYSDQVKAKTSFNHCRLFSDIFPLFLSSFSLFLSLGLNGA